MALATRPKPKAHNRKRQAQHHRQGKAYLKTYWPYLPMFAIIGGGVWLNKYWYAHPALTSSSAGAAVSSAGTSRLQSIFGGNSTWVLPAALVITAIAFAVFIISHWYRLHRYINKGELFIVRHPAWEIATVAIFTFGYVLTRGIMPH